MSAWKTVHLEIHPYLSVSVSEDYELTQNTIQLDWFILWWCQPNLINTMPDWLIIVLGTAKYHCRTGCNESNNWAICFQNVICSAAFFNIRVIFLYDTGPIQWICSEHYGYWWSGVFSNIKIKKRMIFFLQNAFKMLAMKCLPTCSCLNELNKLLLNEMSDILHAVPSNHFL